MEPNYLKLQSNSVTTKSTRPWRSVCYSRDVDIAMSIYLCSKPFIWDQKRGYKLFVIATISLQPYRDVITEFVIPEFVITEFVITEFVITEFVIKLIVIAEFDCISISLKSFQSNLDLNVERKNVEKIEKSH